MHKLGDMYREGSYVPKDEVTAFKLYDRCYRQSAHDESNDAYPACLVKIAECFYKGIGVEADISTAYNLFKEAERILKIQAAAGNHYVKRRLDKVNTELQEIEKTETDRK